MKYFKVLLAGIAILSINALAGSSNTAAQIDDEEDALLTSLTSEQKEKIDKPKDEKKSLNKKIDDINVKIKEAEAKIEKIEKVEKRDFPIGEESGINAPKVKAVEIPKEVKKEPIVAIKEKETPVAKKAIVEKVEVKKVTEEKKKEADFKAEKEKVKEPVKAEIFKDDKLKISDLVETKPEAIKLKIEEPKVAEVKVEKKKVEEPKVEEVKVEEPKVEEVKVEEPKVEEPKVEPVELTLEEKRELITLKKKEQKAIEDAKAEIIFKEDLKAAIESVR